MIKAVPSCRMEGIKLALFDKIKGPIFYKDDSEAERQLEVLKELKQKATGENINAIEREIQGGAEAESNPDVIICPKCGAPMVRRKAAKGPNAGKEFFGCSGFPKCRGIVNIQ